MSEYFGHWLKGRRKTLRRTQENLAERISYSGATSNSATSLGSFTLRTRNEILERLLAAQALSGLPLISSEELPFYDADVEK